MCVLLLLLFAWVIPSLPSEIPFPSTRSSAGPVLLVHGIFSSAADFEAMREALEKNGVHAKAIDLKPNNGTASVIALAQQVDAAVEALRRETDAERIDVVGHSMGALVLRYWLQRMDGRSRVRRYVSLSGPHRGVVAGLLSRLPAAREMRPRSALLRDLAADSDPLGTVEAFDFFTPLDAVIVPATGQQLPGAQVRKAFLVPSHHKMLTDKNVISAVVQALQEGAASFSTVGARRPD